MKKGLNIGLGITPVASQWKIQDPVSMNVTGYSAFTDRTLLYQTLPYGRKSFIVFVVYLIAGTSNATTLTFDLPISYLNSFHTGAWRPQPAYIINNGAQGTIPGRLQINNANGKTVSVLQNMTGSAWTASGTKSIRGQFWYIVS